MGLDGLETVCGVWNQARNFLCALRARFKSEWGLERNRFMGCVLNSSVRLEIGSGRSGHGLRCLEPGQEQLGFQPELEVWTVWTRSGRSGHGLRCLEPVSLQPPITLKPRPKGAKTTAGLVPATSARFQTVQTQLGFQPELLVFQTIFNSMPLSIPG